MNYSWTTKSSLITSTPLLPFPTTTTTTLSPLFSSLPLPLPPSLPPYLPTFLPPPHPHPHPPHHAPRTTHHTPHTPQHHNTTTPQHHNTTTPQHHNTQHTTRNTQHETRNTQHHTTPPPSLSSPSLPLPPPFFPSLPVIPSRAPAGQDWRCLWLPPPPSDQAMRSNSSPLQFESRAFLRWVVRRFNPRHTLLLSLNTVLSQPGQGKLPFNFGQLIFNRSVLQPVRVLPRPTCGGWRPAPGQ